MTLLYNKRLLACIFSGIAFMIACGEIDATQYDCGLEHVHVQANNPRDAAIVCEGIETARRFLASQGLDADTGICVDVVPSLPGEAPCEAAGYYFPGTGKAAMLDYAGFLQLREWFKVPIDRRTYLALAVHEAAHVIAAHNFLIPDPTIQAQEYIAYVTTLATMAPELRRQVLSRYPGDGYETEQQMNATIYLGDPMRFGVEVYRHYLKRGKTEGFFQAILAGAALAE